MERPEILDLPWQRIQLVRQGEIPLQLWKMDQNNDHLVWMVVQDHLEF